MGSLKAFIKSVRAAKTLKDERSVVQKESARIRSAFRDQKLSQRQRRENVAKLLYLFTLNEKTHFGQVECVKLLASPHFTDKRLGYLGTMLLLDENQEVLTLVTNSIDSDLSHPNQYVVSLALTAMANIASEMMARDLCERVGKLLASSNPYLRKKAALCALRVVTRVPEYEEMFITECGRLLNDSNHGVLLGGAALATDLIESNPDMVQHLQDSLPGVLSKLKQLSSNGFSPEFDVGGVPDPFLQCALIKLLRAFGQNSAELSEQMSDLLAAIATNTDNSKNVGNAVLYETVLTIFGIDTGPPQSDSGLRVLGINILAKFLTTKNINTRYSALTTLLRVVEIEPAAVQRHRQTIMDCVRDADVSIRRRALDLSYLLINASNVRLMIRELLSVLEQCDAEFKPQLAFQIALNAERFAPNAKWHIDTLIRMFVHAGNFAAENVLSAFILLVINNPDLQLYATRRVYAALETSCSQNALTLSALWLVGEYGELLIKHGEFTALSESSTAQPSERTCTPTAKKVIDLLVAVMDSPYAKSTTLQYAIDALVKLASRLKEPSDVERIRRIILEYTNSFDVEIQQRAVEYSALITTQGALRSGILAKMPAPAFGDDLEAQHAKMMSKALVKRKRRGGQRPVSTQVAASAASKQQPQPDLLDLGTGDSLDSAETSAAGSGAALGVSKASASDLLSDIFGSPLDNLKQTLPVPTEEENLEVAFENDDLKITIGGRPEGPGHARVVANFAGKKNVGDLNLQVALPKSMQLQLQPLSSASISSTAGATQSMRVSGQHGAAVKLRLRLSYTIEGERKVEQFDFSKLPPNLL